MRAQDWAYSIELSVLEVYNDRLRDLLDAGSKEVTDMNAIRHEFGGAKPSTPGLAGSGCGPREHK